MFENQNTDAKILESDNMYSSFDFKFHIKCDFVESLSVATLISNRFRFRFDIFKNANGIILIFGSGITFETLLKLESWHVIFLLSPPYDGVY